MVRVSSGESWYPRIELLDFTFETKGRTLLPPPSLRGQFIRGLQDYKGACLPRLLALQSFPCFCEIRGTYDTVYRDLHSKGIGTKVCHTPVTTPEEEDTTVMTNWYIMHESRIWVNNQRERWWNPARIPTCARRSYHLSHWRSGIGTEDGWSYIVGSLSHLVSTLQDKYQSTFCCNHRIGL